MTGDDVQAARAADLFWRGLRAQAVVAYLIAGVAVAFSGRTAVIPYVVGALVLAATIGAVYMTRRAREALAPHRNAATGELPFDRRRLRVSDLVPLPSSSRDR